MKLFDAHCHLSEAISIDSMLARAATANVEGVVVCGTSPADWDQAFQTVEKSNSTFSILGKETCALRLSVGIHPWFVDCRAGSVTPPETVITDRCYRWDADFQTLEEMLRDFSMLGIGECGLDFSQKFSNRTEQEECFAAHLGLTVELGRPVSVHCVQAWGRLVEMLKEYPAPKVLLHAYSGSVELIPQLMKLNGWFSFGPAVMNSKAKRARAAVAAVPAERLLIETDSNGEPEKLIDVARAVAALRGVPVEEIAELTFNNAQSLFA
jgi:TatD DNase family protein